MKVSVSDDNMGAAAIPTWTCAQARIAIELRITASCYALRGTINQNHRILNA